MKSRELSFACTDDNGFYVNELSYEKIDVTWKKAVDSIKDKILQILSLDIASIYIRGSVAENKAIAFVSDVDLIIVCKELPAKPEISLLSTEIGLLNEELKFISKIDLSIVHIDSLFSQNSSKYYYSFYIKVFAVHLYGLKLHHDIPPLHLKDTILSQLPFIIANIQNASNKLQTQIHEKNKQRITSWIMKCILRAGFELLIGREKKYSRDIYTCWKVIANYYPQLDKYLEAAYCLAIGNDSPTGLSTLTILQIFESWFSTNMPHCSDLSIDI